MHRHSALVGALLLVGAVTVSCASRDTSSPSTDTGGGDTMAVAGETVTTLLTDITRPETVGSLDRTQLPEKAQRAVLAPSVSDEEQQCVDTAVYKTVQDDPGLASDDNQLGAITGGAIVACVPEEKIVDVVTQRVKQAGATDDQAACVSREFVTAEPDTLAIFVGGLAIGEPAVVGTVSTAVDTTCGTTLGAGATTTTLAP